jgi:CDP-diacylglycerol---serine O-phosphatidyltransferase
MILLFLKKQGANILTLINMILGLIAILLAIRGDFELSSLFILIAALTDRFDGMFARKFKTTSLLGKYLDSNSDLISFGLAPGLLIYLAVLKDYEELGVLISFLFIIAGAFRLARYNAVEFNGYYVGVPITIAGAVLAASVLIMAHIPAIVYVFITLILSYLMVCKHSIKKV